MYNDLGFVKIIRKFSISTQRGVIYGYRPQDQTAQDPEGSDAVSYTHLDGSMCVYKTFFLEELMDCVSNQASHTECCGEHVCSGTQISDLAQEFYAVTFFLQRVVGSGSAFNGNFLCLYFKGLFCFGCFHQQTFDDDGSANPQFCDFCVVGQVVCCLLYTSLPCCCRRRCSTSSDLPVCLCVPGWSASQP